MGLFFGFYGYLTIPEKTLFYREIQTFLYFRYSPVYFRKNAPKCGKIYGSNIALVMTDGYRCFYIHKTAFLQFKHLCE